MSQRRETRRRRTSSWVSTRAERAVADRRVLPYLAGVITIIALITGFLAYVIDRPDFPTFGDGVWWAVVTLATVGYGDLVPHTAWGRALGGVVIVFGVTFISFLVAVVTSLLVEARRAELDEAQAAREEETEALLRKIDARLAAIEQNLRTPDTHP